MLSEIEKANREPQKSNANLGSIVSKIQILNKKLSDTSLERIEQKDKKNQRKKYSKQTNYKATRIIEKEDIANSIGENLF